jgi:hypothetical protein
LKNLKIKMPAAYFWEAFFTMTPRRSQSTPWGRPTPGLGTPGACLELFSGGLEENKSSRALKHVHPGNLI